jgi:protocatechuate 3,4-dioxygenase beta subunit
MFKEMGGATRNQRCAISEFSCRSNTPGTSIAPIVLKGGAAGAAARTNAASFQHGRGIPQELVRTPAQTEGPFYPDRLPLDTVNDLIVINSSITPAAGEITYLTDCIVDGCGNPLRNATVEIWQVGNRGSSLHTRSAVPSFAPHREIAVQWR